MKAKSIEINTDIMRLGEYYYAIKRIECNDMDINTELKELYARKHSEHIDTLNEGIVANAHEDFNKQIEHIRSFSGKGTHTITSSLYGKPVMVHNDNLLQLRMITYAPNKVKLRLTTLVDRVSDVDVSGLPDSITVKVKPLFSIPMLVGYSSKTKQLFTPLQQTFHTYSGGNVCTSTHSGSDFWALSDEALEHDMNVINTFSPANRQIEVNRNGYHIDDLVTPSTFISAHGREEGVWNVSH